MIRIRIRGMSCENCVRHVRQALSKLAGVKSVAVHLHPGEALVDASVPLDEDTVRATVAAEGYEVVAVERV